MTDQTLPQIYADNPIVTLHDGDLFYITATGTFPVDGGINYSSLKANLKSYTDTLYVTGTASLYTNHENLSGLLGGSASNHYHLTSTQLSTFASGTVTNGDQHNHNGGDGGLIPAGGILAKVPLIFGGHGNGGNIVANGTSYIVPYISGLDTAGRSAPMPIAGTVKNLYIRLATAQPATGSLVITIYDATTATSLGIVITIAANSAAGTYSNVVNTSAFTAGNLIQIQIKNNAAAASAVIGGVTFEYDVSLV